MAAKFDVKAGRQYLAALPEFHPTKPLSEYKPATIRRKVEQFQAQQRAGVPISNQAARGHVVTPEHGPRGARPRLPASASEYRGGKLPKSKYLKHGGGGGKPQKPIIHKRPINVPERQDLSDGAIVFTETDLVPVLLHLYNDAWNDRVVLSGFDCERGIWRSLGINAGHGRGWTGSAIIEAWNDEGGGRVLSFEDWFIAIANSTDSDPAQNAERIGHVCMWTVYVYPVNRHLSPRAFAQAR